MSTLLFLVGVGIGASGADEGVSSSSTVTESETVNSEITVTETVRSDEAQRKKLADAVAFVDERRAKLAARAKQLNARAAALRRREVAVGQAEQRVEASTFGDGAYLVGQDIPPGDYVADGGEGCYWARMTPDNTDIIDNHFSTGGQVRATVFSGELFETRGCGTWTPG